MFDTDPTGWRFSTWWLYSLSAYYLLGFLWFFFRFRAAEQNAQTSAAALHRYNRLLRGFPNAVYAKMMGRRRLELPFTSGTSSAPAKPRQDGSNNR